MQYDEPLRSAGDDATLTSPDGPSGDGAVPGTDRRQADRSPLPALTALPRTRRRPLARRAHVRLPGATAGTVERLAWGDRADREPVTVAVSVVPGAALPVAVRRDVVAGADLDELLGVIESGCAPGRHRRAHPAWSALKRLPGWRRVDLAADDDDGAPDDADNAEVVELAAGPATDDTDDDTAELPPFAETSIHADAAQAVGSSPSGEGVIPLPRTDESEEPVWRRRRRRLPAPATRSALQAAQARIGASSGGPAIARAVTEEAGRLVEADVTALVLRAVEGPRVLWLHPGGPDADGLWGPATLAALLRVGHPVRRVVEGDPLADGEATALLTVPVPAGGSIAGTLVARRNEPRTFSATEQDVLSRLARMAGASLLAASRPAARGRGDVDGVTGLPGSQRFSGDVEAALRTSQRRGMPVAVLAVHVEGLGQLRTELGDQPAEDMLEELARALQGVMRVGDLAYRIGPDELALLLPATDGAALDTIRERLGAVAADVVARLGLPGSAPTPALRAASVPLEGVVAGGQVLDAASRALELDGQKVRWTPAP